MYNYSDALNEQSEEMRSIISKIIIGVKKNDGLGSIDKMMGWLFSCTKQLIKCNLSKKKNHWNMGRD